MICIWLALLLGLPTFTLNSRLHAAITTPAEQMVNFSFDQADLRLIVKIVGELTGRRFVLDDRIKGVITVITPQSIPLDDVYPLLVSLLETSGYTVMERPEGIHVIPLPDGATSVGRIVLDDESAEGLITKVFRISHISAVDLAKLLEPLVRGGKAGAVAAFGATNHLLITDTADAVRQFEKLIRDMDIPGASKTVEVIRLKHANADDISRQLIAAMRGSETSGDHVSRHLQRVGGGMGTLPSDMIIVPVPNANSVVVVGTPMQLGQVREIIRLIDIETPVEFGRLNAIFLKYINAEEAAATLNALMAKTTARDQVTRIAIEHNNANNALIIDAAPQDFDVVRKLVEDLDRSPKQVMIEVVIAEVSMGKGLDFGVEWSTVDTPREGSTTFIGRSRPAEEDAVSSFLTDGLFPQGISIGVARGTYVDAAGRVLPRIPFILQALAQDRDVKILSTIPLMAQNNQEASFSVVDNIPILSSRIEGTGDNRDVIQNIERIDVGTKLKLTPHINVDDEVKLILNPSIEAVIESRTEFAPVIAKREVITTVTIPDRSTVVISGLIREDTVKEVRKIPLLGDIPLIGWLFRSHRDRVQRTNLMILVTPHIIRDMRDAQAVKDALENRSSLSVTSSLPSTITSGP
ncbi:MAG TPA: type II secretion system secretin GspD [Kiritimatiellia bacterium]|nr:type II secretion system secretin GspD [Kiritimatiellia bacterium]